MSSFQSYFAQVAGVSDVAFAYPYDDPENDETDGVKAAGEGSEMLITCGADCSVQLREPFSDEVDKEISDHLDAINVVAISPVGGKFATGSDDHVVMLYSYPECDRIASLARFSLSVRAVAFSHDGAQLAAAGDDEGIKILNAQDASIVRVIHGISSVKHLAFDPKGEWLIAGTCDGVMVAYDTDAGMKRKDWGEVLPKVKPSSSMMNRFAFEPSGKYLAVPGRAFEIIVYERETWRELYTLSEKHSDIISVICWSPNGRYLVSAGADKKIIVWDVIKKISVATQESEATICGMSWRRNANCVATIDCEGNLALWSKPVPSSSPSPLEGAAQVGIDEAKYFFDDQAGEDDDNSEDDLDEDDLGYRGTLGVDKSNGVRDQKMSDHSGRVDIIQKPFQPCVTQFSGNPPRRFLAYNLIGSVVSRDEGTFNVIEVSFHDTGVKLGRIPAMNDYYGFTMAALNEGGVALAAPGEGENKQSTLRYRPFESWAANSDWEVQLPAGSQFIGITVGSSWIAATTSDNELRIFSTGGLQTFIMSLPGPPVAMASHTDLLVVVWHDAVAAPSKDQRLSYMVLDIEGQEKVEGGELPLSSGSVMTWLGLAVSSYRSQVATCDSSGVVRVRVSEFGGSWMPVTTKSSEDEMKWIVGVEESTVTFIKCRLPSMEPAVLPKPVLDEEPMTAPVIKVDSEKVDELQQDMIRESMNLTRIKGSTHNSEDIVEDITDAERKLDRCLLRLMHEACKSDQLVRALEAASMLNLKVSLDGALKLANSMRLPALAEKIGVLIRTREELEEMADDGELDDIQRYQRKAASFVDTNATNPFSRSNVSAPTPLTKLSENVDRELLRKTPTIRTPAPIKRQGERQSINPFSRNKLMKTDEQ